MIVFTRDELEGKTTHQLLDVYNKLTGKDTKSFNTRKAGIDQIMAEYEKRGLKPGSSANERSVSESAKPPAIKAEKKAKAEKKPKAAKVRKPAQGKLTRVKKKDLGADVKDKKIFVLDEFRKENPKRKGTAAHKIFDILCEYHGKTVAKYVEETKDKIQRLGARPMGELTWCLTKGFVELRA